MKTLFHLCYGFFKYRNLFLKIICNPHIPNIDAISGALSTLSLSILILNSQCEEGARDGIDIWYVGIIKSKGLLTQTCERSICFSANLVKLVVKSSTRLSSRFLSSVLPSLVILSKKSDAL